MCQGPHDRDYNADTPITHLGMLKTNLPCSHTNIDSNTKHHRAIRVRTASTNSQILQLVPLLPLYTTPCLNRLPPSETPVPPDPAHLLVPHLRSSGAVVAANTAQISAPSSGYLDLYARRSWY